MIQVRLRNLSGILILDMIDMETEEEEVRMLVIRTQLLGEAGDGGLVPLETL